jgi:hypothetical protein
MASFNFGCRFKLLAYKYISFDNDFKKYFDEIIEFLKLRFPLFEQFIISAPYKVSLIERSKNRADIDRVNLLIGNGLFFVIDNFKNFQSARDVDLYYTI